MADNFGLKIGLEGEKEFKKALSDINQNFKVLGSEMKLVASQFDKTDDSVDALAAKNKVLNKEIDTQKQKIETLKSALKNAADSFGEADRRTQNWQVQLNNAEAALNDMQRELSQNNSALEKAENGFDDVGDKADKMGARHDLQSGRSRDGSRVCRCSDRCRFRRKSSCEHDGRGRGLCGFCSDRIVGDGHSYG